MPTYFNKTAQTWYCKFYYKDYMGQTKQKKKSGFRLQREAREWERSFISRHEGRLDMLFSDLHRIYMEAMKHRLRESTLLTKGHLINTKILPYFGNIPVNQIEPSTIRAWQDMMCTKQTAGGGPYSATYLKCMNNQLSAIFNYAVRYYHLPCNPCRTAGSMGKKQAKAQQFWRPEEFHVFLNYFPRESEAALIFSLLYYTGIRVGELLALGYDDFNLQKEVVIISKSYRRIHKNDVLTPPKTPKSFRVIALPGFLIVQIGNYFKEQKPADANARIFCKTSYYHIRKYMEEACEHCKIKRIRIHDLRHSHASLLIELGMSPVLIAERLGHENVETTLNTYSHLYPHRQKELADTLQNVYGRYSSVK